MNRKLFVFLMSLICTAGIVLIANYGYVQQHEAAHQQVFRNFGCNSTVSISFNAEATGLTSPDPNCKSSNELALAQSNVEAIGYQISLYLNLLIFLVSIIILYTLLENITRDSL